MSRHASSSRDRDIPKANEFQQLLTKAGAGDSDACRHLYDHYQKPVLRVIRRLINPRLRTIIDSRDLTQEVWKSVFNLLQEGRRFTGPDHFIAFLLAVTHNKAIRRNRDAIEVQKRSLSREEPFDEHLPELLNLPDPAEGPMERAVMEDEYAKLLLRLSNRDQAIVRSLRAGDSLEHVAQQAGVSVKTVRRFAVECGETRSDSEDQSGN